MPKVADPIFPVMGSTHEHLVGLYHTIDGVLRDSDIARRESRRQSGMMLSDHRISQPYDKMRITVASLPWHVVPENESDEGQRVAAEKLEDLIAFDNHVEVFQNLMSAYWYGRSGGGLRVKYDDRERQYFTDGMDMIHGDTIMFREDGEPMLRVGPGYKGDDILQGPESRVRPLKDWERDIFVLHIYNIEPPEFFEPVEAANLYTGVGKRQQCWYTWWVSHQMERMLVDYAERLSLGVVIGRFPEGNDNARSALESALLNYKQSKAMMLPSVMSADNKDLYSLELVEPSGLAGVELFKWFIDEYTATLLRQNLEGQTLTSQTANTGLGANLANVHQNTFLTYVKFLARALQETISRQVVARLQRWNDIMPEVRFRFEFVVDDADPSAKLQAIKDAYAMNIGDFIKVDDVLAVANLTKADPADDVLGQNIGIGVGGATGMGLGTNPGGGGGAQLESRLAAGLSPKAAVERRNKLMKAMSYGNRNQT